MSAMSASVARSTVANERCNIDILSGLAVLVTIFWQPLLGKALSDRTSAVSGP